MKDTHNEALGVPLIVDLTKVCLLLEKHVDTRWILGKVYYLGRIERLAVLNGEFN